MDAATRRAHLTLALAELQVGFPLIAAGKIHARHAEADALVDQTLSGAESALDRALEDLAGAMRVLTEFCGHAGH